MVFQNKVRTEIMDSSRKMDRELLFSITKKDFNVETMRSTKSGGQRRDKVETAVRITHPPSGAVGFSQDQRTQEQNKKIAFRRLLETDEWSKWFRIECAIRTGALIQIDEWIDEMVRPENIKIETFENGKWKVS